MKHQVIKTQLEEARRKQRTIRKEVERLRELMKKAGYDPDAPKIDLIPRNKVIFRKWRDGSTYTKLAVEFNLTPTRIGYICKRIEHILNNSTIIPKEYNDLL